MPRIFPGAVAASPPAVGSGLVSLGTGDGTTTAFTLPVADIEGHMVLVAGIPQPPSGAFTISRGTGPSGADQVVFTAAPAVGVAVEAFWVS